MLMRDGGADANKMRDDGASPLFLAAQNGHLSVCRLLLREGKANASQKMVVNGATALHVASQRGHVDVCLLLRAEGAADPNQPMFDGTTSLHCAAQQGNTDVLRALLRVVDDGKSPAGLVNKTKPRGISPLFGAAQYGHLDACKLLLQHGADPNQADAETGTTALTVAAAEGHVEVCRLLVKSPVVNHAMHNGASLFVAAQEGHADVCRVLIADGEADVNFSREDGATPLLIATHEGHIDACRVLVEEGGADVNQAMESGITPLFQAGADGNKDMVRLLIKNGAQELTAPEEGVSDAASAYNLAWTTDYLSRKRCDMCDRMDTKACAGCGAVRYCSRECQKRGWKTHKLVCKK